MAERGKFVVIEGQGFSGKTVQAKMLVEQLQNKDLDVVLTKHPGGIPSTQALREELLRRKAEDPNFSPDEEFDLMSRSLHLLYREAVKPALDCGKWVISDRYWASVKVYQGYEAGFNLQVIKEHESQSSPPHRYLFLNVPPEEIVKRTLSAKREIHSFNQTDLDKLTLRHLAYQDIALGSSKQWRVVDGMGTIDEVQQRVWENLTDLLI